MARVSLKSQLEQAQEEIKVLRATLEKLLQNSPEVLSTLQISEVLFTPHTAEVVTTPDTPPELITESQPQPQPELITESQPQPQPELITESQPQPQPELIIEPQSPQSEPKPKTQQPSPRIQSYRMDKEQRIKTLDQARMAWRTVDQEHRTHYMRCLGKKFLTNDDILHFFTTVYPTLKPSLTQP